VIYDWDSLAFEKEPIIVGHASWYFTYTEFFGGSRLDAIPKVCVMICYIDSPVIDAACLMLFEWCITDADVKLSPIW